MTIWPVMFGVGIGLIVTLITIIANQKQHRTISDGYETTYFSPPDEICPICLNNMANSEMKYLNCGHAFHDECFRNMITHGNNICPCCRNEF